ncbi:ferredoxin [Actinokineospora xionganensis]|uniref:Ferredoxin n=1 Tax=Actinokineospora xionganensis TaxID=2684470 RepID=A0ABR7L3F4_9PSEU|nr:ferredoxin [Actinokineospora xionganensis]MBC6446959.1 ferredoxin [Actinokineospora xionganensis]
MTWKLEVNAGACMASGLCAGIAPDHFTLEGVSAVANSPEVEPDDDVLEAAESCPAMAISVTENGRDLLA